MSEPENNSPKKDDISSDDKEDKKESENILKILDELLTHTNKSRRLFLIFIATALLFGPAAVILGSVLLGHPDYNLRQLENEEFGGNDFHHMPPGTHVQLVDRNGTVIKDLNNAPLIRPHSTSIFLELRIFITISIIFAIILLLIAIKEYKFFSRWNKRFTKYRTLRDKVDKELEED